MVTSLPKIVYCCQGYGLNLDHRSHYSFFFSDQVCAEQGCPLLSCEDQSCVLPDQSCLILCLAYGAHWIPVPSSQRLPWLPSIFC